MKHVIECENFYPLTDVRNRYTYYEKKYGKITLERLEELVKEGVIESRELPVEGTLYTYTVYNEYDIIVALAKRKFKDEINTEQWL